MVWESVSGREGNPGCVPDWSRSHRTGTQLGGTGNIGELPSPSDTPDIWPPAERPVAGALAVRVGGGGGEGGRRREE